MPLQCAALVAPRSTQSAAACQGGHFAALEQPQLLFDDIIAFADKVKL